MKKLILTASLMVLSATAIAKDLGTLTIPAGGEPARMSTDSLLQPFSYDLICHIQNPVADNTIVIQDELVSGWTWSDEWALNGKTFFPSSLQSQLNQGDNVFVITSLKTSGNYVISFYNGSPDQDMTVSCSATFHKD